MPLASASAAVDDALASADSMLSDFSFMGRKVPLHSTDCHVATLIRKVLLRTCSNRVAKDSKIHCQLDESAVIGGDWEKLDRALANVLENAVHAATTGNDEVWISSRTEVDGEIEIEIRNTGSYIGEKDRERIFEPFVTFGQTSGTGLGLTVTRKIMELNSGSVHCRSSKEMGTLFVFRFPKIIPGVRT